MYTHMCICVCQCAHASMHVSIEATRQCWVCLPQLLFNLQSLMQLVGEARVLLSYPQCQGCHVLAFYVIVLTDFNHTCEVWRK